MKMKEKIVVIVVCSMLVLSGCQVTPDNNIVRNKNQDYVDTQATSKESKNIEEAPKNDLVEYVAPPERNYSESNNGVEINVNAVIIVPPCNEFPIVKAVPAPFTQDMFEKITETLAKGNKVYLNDFQKTKEEWEDEYIRRKAEFQDAKLHPEKYDDMLSEEEQEQLLQYLEEKIKIAPETLTEAEAEQEIDFTNKAIYLKVDLGKAEPATINIMNDPDNSIFSISYSNGNNKVYNKATNALEYSEDEAVELARRTVSDLGINYMEPVHIKQWFGYANELDTEPDSTFYEIVFGRIYEGISTNYDQITSANDDSEEDAAYSSYWDYEKLVVHIDDSGVSSIQWKGNMEMMEDVTIKTAADILPFDEIEDIFLKNIQMKHINMDNPTLEKVEINIDSISLGFTQVTARDQPGKFYLIPVWDFYGNDKYYYKDGTNSENDNSSYLTINAIDGSIINRYRGY